MKHFAAMAKQRKRGVDDQASGLQSALAVKNETPALASASASPAPTAMPLTSLPFCHSSSGELAQQVIKSPRVDSAAASTPPHTPYAACGPVMIVPNTGCVPTHISSEEMAAMLEKAAPKYYVD